MASTPATTDTAAAAELGRSSAVPTVIPFPDADLAASVHEMPRVVFAHRDLVPHDLSALLKPMLLRPYRPQGLVVLQSLDAFVAFVRDHTDPTHPRATTVYFDQTLGKERLTAIFDAHENAVLAGHQEFRATFAFRYADAWTAWKEVDGDPQSVPDFADFLDERIADVFEGSPSPGMATVIDRLSLRLAGITDLVALSRGLAVNATAKVKNAVVTSTGEITMQYEESHTGANGEPVRIANAFLIGLPVFLGTAPMVSLVRLSYRLNGGLVTWKTQVHDLVRVHEHAIAQAKALVVAGVPEGVRLYDGESPPK